MTNFMYIFCLIVWGLNFIAVKIQGTPVSLELSLTYRLVITAFLFGLLAWLMKPQGKPQQHDFPFIIVFGICNFAFSYLALYYATMLSSAAIVTLIFSLKVILTPIALRLFLKEPLHRRVLIGGILGVIGVGVLIYPTLHSFSGLADLKGVLIALLGTVLTAIGDASSARNAKRQIDPIYANAIGFTVGSVVMCGIVWIQGQKNRLAYIHYLFISPTVFNDHRIISCLAILFKASRKNWRGEEWLHGCVVPCDWRDCFCCHRGIYA